LYDVGAVKGDFIIDDSQVIEASKRVSSMSQVVAKDFLKMTAAVFTAQGAYDLIKKAIGNVINYTKESIVAFTNSEKVVTRLKGVMGSSTNQHLQYAKVLMNLVNIEDEDVMAIQTRAKTMGVANEKVDEYTQKTLALAKAMDLDYNSALKAVILSESGQYEALNRVIPSLRTVTDNSQKLAIVQNAIATGWNQLTAATQTLGGKFEGFKVQSGEVSEALGGLLAPALGVIVPLMTEGARQTAEFISSLSEVPDSKNLENEQIKLNQLVMELTNVNITEERRGQILAELNKINSEVVAGINKESINTGLLLENLKKANEEYARKIFIAKQEEVIDKIRKKAGKESLSMLNEEANMTKILGKAMIQANNIKEDGKLKEIASLPTWKEKIKLARELMDYYEDLSDKEYARARQLGFYSEEGKKALDLSGKYGSLSAQLQLLGTSYNQYAYALDNNAKYTKAIMTDETALDKLLASLGIKRDEVTTKTNKNTESSKLNELQLQENIALLEHKIKIEDISVDTVDEQIAAYEKLATQYKMLGNENENLMKIEEKLDELRKKRDFNPALESWKEYNNQVEKITIAGINKQSELLKAQGEDESKIFKWKSEETGKIIIEWAGTITSRIGAIVNFIKDGLSSVFDTIAMYYQNDIELLMAADQAKLDELTTSKEQQMEAIQSDYDRQLEALDNSLSSGQITKIQYDERKKLLDDQKAAKEKETQKKTDDQIAAQKAENLKKENEEKKKAFEANKANQIAMCWVNFAVGAVSAYVGAFQALGWIPTVGPALAIAMGTVMTGLLLGSAIAQCHGKGVKIKMFDGTLKKVEDVKIKDKILGDDNKERNVLELYNGKHHLYKIDYGKYSWTCTLNHILSLYNKKENKFLNIELEKYLNNEVKYKNYYLYKIVNNKIKIIKKVKFISIGIKDYFGFKIDGNNLYQLEDGTVTHNTVMISQQQYVPARAMGGNVQAGQSYQVNEYGQEIFTPNVNGYISPAGVTKNIIENVHKNSRSSNFNIIMANAFDGAIIRDSVDMEEVTDIVIKKMGEKFKGV
jgi:hypothetical protein